MEKVNQKMSVIRSDESSDLPHVAVLASKVLGILLLRGWFGFALVLLGLLIQHIEAMKNFTTLPIATVAIACGLTLVATYMLQKQRHGTSESNARYVWRTTHGSLEDANRRRSHISTIHEMFATHLTQGFYIAVLFVLSVLGFLVSNKFNISDGQAGYLNLSTIGAGFSAILSGCGMLLYRDAKQSIHKSLPDLKKAESEDRDHNHRMEWFETELAAIVNFMDKSEQSQAVESLVRRFSVQATKERRTGKSKKRNTKKSKDFSNTDTLPPRQAA